MCLNYTLGVYKRKEEILWQGLLNQSLKFYGELYSVSFMECSQQM